MNIIGCLISFILIGIRKVVFYIHVQNTRQLSDHTNSNEIQRAKVRNEECNETSKILLAVSFPLVLTSHGKVVFCVRKWKDDYANFGCNNNLVCVRKADESIIQALGIKMTKQILKWETKNENHCLICLVLAGIRNAVVCLRAVVFRLLCFSIFMRLHTHCNNVA
jgi:hypothetical protein